MDFIELKSVKKEAIKIFNGSCIKIESATFLDRAEEGDTISFYIRRFTAPYTKRKKCFCFHLRVSEGGYSIVCNPVLYKDYNNINDTLFDFPNELKEIIKLSLFVLRAIKKNNIETDKEVKNYLEKEFIKKVIESED